MIARVLNGQVPRYGILDFQYGVRKREYLATDFLLGEGKFHVSAFKWGRGVADRSGFAESPSESDPDE